MCATCVSCSLRGVEMCKCIRCLTVSLAKRTTQQIVELSNLERIDVVAIRVRSPEVNVSEPANSLTRTTVRWPAVWLLNIVLEGHSMQCQHGVELLRELWTEIWLCQNLRLKT